MRFPSSNTIEFNFPFKVGEEIRNYIRAALGQVTEWYNEEQAKQATGAPRMEIIAAMEVDNYAWIMQTLDKVGPECSMQFTVPNKTRALRVGEIFGQLAAVGAPPMKINLTHKWAVMESIWHYTTVECTWGKGPPWKGTMLLKEAAQFPNVEIGGQGNAGRAWITGGGKGTNTGSLSSLQCIDTTKVKLITNEDGNEEFEYQNWRSVKETAPKQEEAKSRKAQEARQQETVGSDSLPTAAIAWMEITDRRQGKGGAVYIYECLSKSQTLVNIVDQVIIQNELVIPRWERAYIKFRPTWKPNGDSMKVYREMAAPARMKKFQLHQLAGKQIEGTGMGSGRPRRYERTIIFSTEDPPLVEATLGHAGADCGVGSSPLRLRLWRRVNRVVYETSLTSHARQEKTTSPHGDISMLLDSSIFWSTRSVLQLVHQNPPCEFAVRFVHGSNATTWSPSMYLATSQRPLCFSVAPLYWRFTSSSDPGKA